ncbi:MAG: LppP/LprE family lipoprotein [Steroidobacteraceae bacterium]
MQRIALSVIAFVLSPSAGSQPGARLWLDSASLESWNRPGLALPSAPQGPKNPDPRCRELLRAPASAEDRELRAQGWDLIGTPTESGQVRVIPGAVDYDGMCRPRQYQFFVFSRGTFVGTLSPDLMDSRTDGSLNRVAIEGDRKLKAYYARYAQTDPLCCPSRTTTVLFSIGHDPPVLKPLTATTASNLSSSAPR